MNINAGANAELMFMWKMSAEFTSALALTPMDIIEPALTNPNVHTV